MSANVFILIQILIGSALINTPHSWAPGEYSPDVWQQSMNDTVDWDTIQMLLFFTSQREKCASVERRQWRVATSWLKLCLLWPNQSLQWTTLIHSFCFLIFGDEHMCHQSPCREKREQATLMKNIQTKFFGKKKDTDYLKLHSTKYLRTVLLTFEEVDNQSPTSVTSATFLFLQVLFLVQHSKC